MSEVFETNSVVVSKVIYNGNVTEINGEINVTDVKKVASEAGIKKFTLETENGDPIHSSDFPLPSGRTVVIKEYNAPKVS